MLLKSIGATEQQSVNNKLFERNFTDLGYVFTYSLRD